MIIRIICSYGIVSIVAFFVIAFTGIGKNNTAENGMLEVLQLFALCVSFVVFTMLASHMNRRGKDTKVHRFLYFVPVIIFLVIGRELSWLRILGVSEILGIPSKTMWLTIFAVYALYVSCKTISHIRKLGSFIKEYHSLLTYASIGVMWAVFGDAMDKDIFDIGALHQYYEELAELLGYTTLSYAGIKTINSQSTRGYIASPTQKNTANS